MAYRAHSSESSLPGTGCLFGVAIAQILGRDAVVVRFPAGSGWSIQALLDRLVSFDTLALVWGKVAVGVRKLSWNTVAAQQSLLCCMVGPLVSGFCDDGTGTPRHDVTGSVVDSGPRRSLRFSVVHG